MADSIVQHRETKKYFDVQPVDTAVTDWGQPGDLWWNEWAAKQGATHVIRVSHDDKHHSDYRAARVLKTVAHVLVDENVWEKWPIKTIF